MARDPDPPARQGGWTRNRMVVTFLLGLGLLCASGEIGLPTERLESGTELSNWGLATLDWDAFLGSMEAFAVPVLAVPALALSFTSRRYAWCAGMALAAAFYALRNAYGVFWDVSYGLTLLPASALIFAAFICLAGATLGSFRELRAAGPATRLPPEAGWALACAAVLAAAPHWLPSVRPPGWLLVETAALLGIALAACGARLTRSQRRGLAVAGCALLVVRTVAMGAPLAFLTFEDRWALFGWSQILLYAAVAVVCVVSMVMASRLAKRISAGPRSVWPFPLKLS